MFISLDAAVERLKQIFRRPAFHLLLFAVFSALLGWPLLTIDDHGQGAAIFWYLLVVWCLAILSLSVTAWGLKKPKGEAEGSDQDAERRSDG